MKKLASLLAVCMVLTLVFTSFALAETTVGSGTKNISGSGTLTVNASEAPKYITVQISNCSGIGYGVVTVDKPDGTSYSNFIEFTSNTTKKVRVYNTVAGNYDFNVALAGSCTITVTMTK